MTAGQPHRFEALDGWRGICALLIALHHFPAHGALYRLSLVRNAWILVDFFFVLSGFVIAHAYRERLATYEDAKLFAIRRFFRLWPLHVAVLAGFLALELYRHAVTGAGFTGARSLFALFTNVALIQSLGIHDMLTWNTPAWAVSTEFWTALLFALVALAAGRLRLVLQIAFVTGSIAVLALGARYGMRETFDWGIARCVYGFFLGALAYEAWVRNRFARMNGTVLETGGAMLAIVFLIVVPGHRPLEYLAPPVFALFIVAFAGDGGALSKATRPPILQRLGQWSYAIYLVQMLAIVLIVSALDSFAPGHTAIGADGAEFIRLGSPLADDAITLIYLVFVIVLAAMAWRFVEAPAQRMAIRTFLPPTKPMPSTAGTNR
jgi:peptidoglycan/LPS O-acetylase OafA/YrhL